VLRRTRLSEDVVHLLDPEMRDLNMVMHPALPLSEQILAWILQALGYADDKRRRVKVSHSTLKNARRGAVIPQSWDALVAGTLEVLGLKPAAELRAGLPGLLRSWDERVGELPATADLSLAESIHVLLLRAIPELGIRLGAMAAWAAVRTCTPFGEWLWLVEPFDRRFFGRVVDALFKYRRPDLTTNDKRRGALENDDGVDWRTVERWRSGDIDVPNAAHLESLACVFRNGSEDLLRAARLACVLRGSLREWIGDESSAEWTSAVAEVGRGAAQALSDPVEMATLLRWFHADLLGPRGDGVLVATRPMLPEDARALPRHELCERLASAVSALEDGSTVDHPYARWVIGLTMVLPHPQFSAGVCGMLGLLPAMDFFRIVESDWMLRSLMKAVATGDMSGLTRADGSPAGREISGAARETAGRWVETCLRFRAAAGDSPNDAEVFAMLTEVAGDDALLGFKFPPDDARHLLVRFIEMFGIPTAAMEIPEGIVANSRALCFSRARVFAERGDASGALDWVGRARHLVGPMAISETADLLATLSMIAHGLLDEYRLLRERLQAVPEDEGAAEFRGALIDGALLAESIVTMILEIGEAPEATHALLATLVAAIPVAIRVAYLRMELSSEDEGLRPVAVDALVARLRACMDVNPTHGRGWAVLMLWTARSGPTPEATKQEKLATHFGARDFLEGEVVRLEKDRGLSQDAG
jgi:hypothetical protein